MSSHSDVVIIGGGVIGLACAHYLTEQGIQVRIIEKNKIGKGSSHGNCGLLYFSDIKPLCSPGTVSHEIARTLMGTSPLYIKPSFDIKRLLWLLRFAGKCTSTHMKQSAADKYDFLIYSMNLFTTLFEQNKLNCDFERKGVLTLFNEKKNFNAYGELNAFLEPYDLAAQKLGIDDLQKLEPAVSDKIAGGWLNTNDWHLRPDALMSSWRKLLSQKGVIMEEDCQMTEFRTNGSKISGVNTNKGEFTANNFVMAAGAWTPLTLKQLKLDLPVQPGKGYSITMERPGLCPDHPCILYEKNMVVTPWNSGYRLGGTMEFSGYSDSLNEKRISKLMSGAAGYLKDPIGNPVTEEWTSLRPMTYDDMPIIDRSPEQENLIIATGHGMLGLTLATGTGKIVCDLLYGNKPEINIKPFGLRRFK